MKDTVQSLRDYFNHGHTKPLSWRREQLLALKKMLMEKEQEFSEALRADLHKSPAEAWLTEISYLTGDVDHALKHLNRWTKIKRVPTPIVTQPGRSFIRPEPLGVVLIIGAWNYPLQLALGPFIAAIAAGNCAVLKPSEVSPNTSNAIARWLPEYLDKDAFAVVEGGVPETTALLEQRFDHVLYTGNAQVGRIVMAAASKHLTPVTLELGGKSPCIVDSSANLAITAQRIAWGKFMNAGQTCVAPDYIITTQDVEAQLLPLLRKAIQSMFGENPRLAEDYGRIINGRHCERLQGYLSGGDIALGGEVDISDCYLEPTVLHNVSLDSAVMQEEIFGPILPIVQVEKIEDAIEFINLRDKPLALYVFSGSASWQEKVLQETSSGSVAVNDTFMFMANPDLPFGGVGESGMGCYSADQGFKAFSHYKAVMKRPFLQDVPLRFAPFTHLKLRLLKLLR
ncbi:MAG: aldehyde dehydrogenase family protein [Cellvibrionaceae bacterium]